MMRLEDVSGQYKTITGKVQAVNHVTFEIRDDEIFGIAGESGCGKSTLLKLMYDIVRFPLELSGGRVVLQTKKGELASGEISKAWWDQISYVPQAAMSVLNPVYRVEDQFFELFRRHRKGEGRRAMRERGDPRLTELELPLAALPPYPHPLSGGMRQRVVIAMATFLQPDMIFADEPTTALDVVVQRNILMMLTGLQQKMHNTLVIVSHDMGVHYQITSRLGIMYSGNLVELGPTEEIFAHPLHPYTRMLIAALPRVGDRSEREGIAGAPPSLRNPPPGCRFAPRCKYACPGCGESVPALTEVEPGRFAACLRMDELKGGA